ncbi:putative Tapt1 family protein [Septoria linicola]|nr:putative Tapt1 family protein [Septoria linicola]
MAGNRQLSTPSPSPSLASVADDPTEGDDTVRGRRASTSHRRPSSEATSLSFAALQHLTTSPDSLPLRPLIDDHDSSNSNGLPALDEDAVTDHWYDAESLSEDPKFMDQQHQHQQSTRPSPIASTAPSPHLFQRRQSSTRNSRMNSHLAQLRIEDHDRVGRASSPKPPILPIPPRSLPTYLHLELASERPSALYIHRSAASDMPYETSAVKLERLHNFLMLPPQLERVLVFGAIACLDAWLYTFTILPLRFLNALVILSRWIAGNASREASDIASFVYQGIGRVWHRSRPKLPAQQDAPLALQPDNLDQDRRVPDTTSEAPPQEPSGTVLGSPVVSPSDRPANPSPAHKTRKTSNAFRHRRTRSTPSVLLPSHKADLLQGLLIVSSCIVLMWFDASRMYHSIRGQAAIKLYVIYNVLEVFDRLLSALGQDILECLFSREMLERNADGRSKISRPFWMFLLALVYVIGHSTALFYQVVTLNVAVNSYSNALLTLLMSNQFVEIKGTVFKKFEKENLFQLTCADVVERFQLWLMLLIIALRNIVEVGGLSISLSSAFETGASSTQHSAANGTGLPLLSGLVIPKAFTLMPKWTGEVLGPFLIVLGSEALVDWCKHAYISKFNNVKPNIYGRFLDVLAKDYYSHAFVDQNLTKRLGLPIIPLSCLFIRAMVQTYHMFLATHMPAPIPSSATSLSVDSENADSSSLIMAALHNFDNVLRRALGSSTFGAGQAGKSAYAWWSLDDFLALATMVIVFLAVYLVLLAFKLVLGMCLLSYARNRYRDMKAREEQSLDTHGRRVGGWGTVEVSEDKRRWIYDDDPGSLASLKEKEARGRQKIDKSGLKLDSVDRYTMVAKRIW